MIIIHPGNSLTLSSNRGVCWRACRIKTVKKKLTQARELESAAKDGAKQLNVDQETKIQAIPGMVCVPKTTCRTRNTTCRTLHISYYNTNITATTIHCIVSAPAILPMLRLRVMFSFLLFPFPRRRSSRNSRRSLQAFRYAPCAGACHAMPLPRRIARASLPFCASSYAYRTSARPYMRSV